MDSYRNSFTSLSDLSQMFAPTPPSITYLYPADDHPAFLNKERERRGKMADMYALLRSFLPNLASNNKQPSREKIVTEAIDLIKRLEADKSRLDHQLDAKLKAKAMVSTAVSVSHAAVAFEIKWRKMRTLTHLIEVFDRHGAEILSASFVDDGQGMVKAAVTAAIGDHREAVVDRIKSDLLILLAQV